MISTSSISARVGSIGGAFPLVEQAASVASCRVETTVYRCGVGSIGGAFPLVEQAASVASCRVETTVCLCVGVISTSSISGVGSISARVGSIGGAFPLVEQAASVASCRVETTVYRCGVGSIGGAFPLVEQAASVASCRVETTVCLCVGVISTSSISGVGSISARVGSIGGWGDLDKLDHRGGLDQRSGWLDRRVG